MRILQINTQDRPGGAADIARRLHHGFQDKGHDAWLAVGSKNGEDEKTLSILNHVNRSAYVRTLIYWSASLRTNNQIPGAWRASRLLSWIAEPYRQLSIARGFEDFDYPGTRDILNLLPVQPDIVHCHNLHGGYFDLRALPDISGRIPTLITLHDAWLLGGHCAHSFECERWKSGCGRCPYPTLYQEMQRDASAQNWRRKRNIYRQSHLYVATPCHWLMDKVNASILAEGMADCRVIPQGVDLSIFSPGDRQAARARLGIPEDVRVLLFAADGIKKNPWKDFSTMRRVLKEVADADSGTPVWLVALGESADDEKIGDGIIHFVPHQNHAEKVADYYRAADIYLHAATADTFPTTVLESLACGTPVVATAVGGICEQVDDGATGFLVTQGDAPAMAQKILMLLADDMLLRGMRKESRKQAEKRFSQEMMVEAYLRWYEFILDRKGRSKGEA